MTESPPLAKYLASTDKKTRDKAIQSLSSFLSDPAQDAIPKPEMTKLWKGIFYCFWMSDKPLVQQALATELAELVLIITTTSSSLAFLDGFWEATVREWNGIDRLRIDKYYMLVRRFVNASFRLLIREKWDADSCEKYNEILIRQNGPLCPTDTRVPTSLAYHLADIYLEELDKALLNSESPPPVPLSIILQPFFNLAAQTTSSTTYKRVESSVLRPLLDALPSGQGPPPAKRQKPDVELENLITNSSFASSDDENPEKSALRKQLLKHIFEVAGNENTRDSNRRKLYALWKSEAEEEEHDD